jgi:hypothetical protein
MTTKQNTKPTVVLNDKRNWHPEIYYEEGTDGMAGQFPFVQIPNDKDMPTMFFILGARETGDTTASSSGDPEAIVEMEMYSYVNMQQLQEVMSFEDYDNLRMTIGLKPLNEAVAKGLKQSEEMAKKINNQHQQNMEQATGDYQ